MSHLKSEGVLWFIIMSIIIGLAHCNLITMETWGQSCFLEIQTFQYPSIQFLSDFLRDNSLQQKAHTLTIGNQVFQERLNKDETFYITCNRYINCKSLCNIHVFVQPHISGETIKHFLGSLRYTSLILVTSVCLRSFNTRDFTTSSIFVHSLGCGKMQFHNVPNAYATLLRAFTNDGVFYKTNPLFHLSKTHSLHNQTVAIGPIRKIKKNTDPDGDTDLIIAEIVMDSMNISLQNANGNIYTKYSEMRGGMRYVTPNVFRVKFFTRIIQEQIVYCPKQKINQQTNYLPLLFLFAPFYTCASILIATILITTAFYLKIIAGNRQGGILKRIKIFMHTLFTVFKALLGQERVKKTKSICLLLLGIAAIMLGSTYKNLLTVGLVAPDNILEPSCKNLSILKDRNYHILCSELFFKMYYPNAGDELHTGPMRLYCTYNCLLSKSILNDFLSEFEKSSLKDVGFYVRGKGDMYNGKSFEINNFIRRKTNCNSLENALSYEYSFIVYNNLGYLKAIFKTRLLQESGVASFVERMEMYQKYEINNWSSIKRRPKSSHPKYSGAFRLAQKHIRPIFTVIVVLLLVDFIAVLIEVYTFRWKILKVAVPRIINGCCHIYSYVFPFKTIQDKYIQTTRRLVRLQIEVRTIE